MFSYYTLGYTHFGGSAMKTTARETQADWIMLRLIELHVQRAGEILLI